VHSFGQSQFTIFPDYDLVGLKNYLFLKNKISNINIFIPENLPELLKRYGKPEKLNSSTSRKIIEQTQDIDALKIYSQILKYGVGLDQESLMLNHGRRQDQSSLMVLNDSSGAPQTGHLAGVFLSVTYPHTWHTW